MNAAQPREAAQRVLLDRCDHAPGEACVCAEQMAADVDALISSGLLRLPADHQEGTR